MLDRGTTVERGTSRLGLYAITPVTVLSSSSSTFPCHSGKALSSWFMITEGRRGYRGDVKKMNKRGRSKDKEHAGCLRDSFDEGKNLLVYLYVDFLFTNVRSSELHLRISRVIRRYAPVTYGDATETRESLAVPSLSNVPTRN